MTSDELHKRILLRAYGKDRLRADELPSIRRADGRFLSDRRILERLPGWRVDSQLRQLPLHE